VPRSAGWHDRPLKTVSGTQPVVSGNQMRPGIAAMQIGTWEGAWLAIPILAMTHPTQLAILAAGTLIALVLVGLSMTALWWPSSPADSSES